MTLSTITALVLILALVMLFAWLYQNRNQVKTAVGKSELLIAAKREEMIANEREATRDVISIQRQIDECDTKIHALRKERQRFETEMEAARGRADQRAKQSQAELNALLAESESRQGRGTFVIPEGGSVEIRTNEN